MSEELRSAILGTACLSIAGVIALCLTLVRGSPDTSPSQLQAATRLAVGTLLLQAAHFAEELATGFHQRFPELLGLSPWSQRFFVALNLILLAIWGLSIQGLKGRPRAAIFPTWFLGIVSVVNGLAHPGIAISVGGYFPGLITSPLVGVAVLLLVRRLSVATTVRRSIRG